MAVEAQIAIAAVAVMENTARCVPGALTRAAMAQVCCPALHSTIHAFHTLMGIEPTQLTMTVFCLHLGVAPPHIGRKCFPCARDFAHA